MPPDFSNNLQEYEKFRRPFPSRVYRELMSRSIGLPGQCIIDMGSGTGLIGHGFETVPLTLIQLDVNEGLICAGHKLRQWQNIRISKTANIFPIVSPAESCPFADDIFDGVVVAQSWHWFDRTVAPVEMLRILKPGGKLGVVYTCTFPAVTTSPRKLKN